jgi:hypothetical protein
MATARRTRYVLVLQPEPGVDPIRALRWALKSLLRKWGLRCVDLAEVAPEEETSIGRKAGPFLARPPIGEG